MGGQKEALSPVTIDPTSAASVMAGEDPMHAFVSERLEEWLSFSETDDEARVLMLEWMGRISS